MSSPLNPYQSPQPTPASEQAAAAETKLERPIHVAGKLTLDEGLEADRLARRTEVRRALAACRWTILAVIVALLVVDGLVRPESRAPLALIIVGLLAAALLGSAILPGRLRRQSAWRREIGLFAPYQATISENEVELLRGTATFRLRWVSFAGYRATDEVAVLYFDFPKRYWVLARPHFSDDGQWQLLLDVLRRKLPRL